MYFSLHRTILNVQSSKYFCGFAYLKSLMEITMISVLKTKRKMNISSKCLKKFLRYLSTVGLIINIWMAFLVITEKNTNLMQTIDQCSFKIEPINSLPPRVSQADKLNIPRVRKGERLNLLCPVQSFPVSIFR